MLISVEEKEKVEEEGDFNSVSRFLSSVEQPHTNTLFALMNAGFAW